MKALIVIALLVIAAVIGWQYFSVEMKTEQFGAQVAFGSVVDSGIQMDLKLTQRMVENESPSGSTINTSTWQDWMQERFQITDGAGRSLDLKFQNSSTLIGASSGSPDVGFLSVKCTPGATYDLSYTPVVGEPLVYRQDFTAPSGPKSTYVLKLISR